MAPFLTDIEITFIAPCPAEPEKIRLKGRFSRDVSEVFPYLNAVVPGADYSHEGKWLVLVKEFRRITLYPAEFAMTKALNTTDAMQVLAWLKDLINRTYEARADIVPKFDSRPRPNALQVYKLLPKSNCGECGENTCLAFAAKLLLGEQELGNCRPLQSDREALCSLLELVGPFLSDEPAPARGAKGKPQKARENH